MNAAVVPTFLTLMPTYGHACTMGSHQLLHGHDGCFLYICQRCSRRSVSKGDTRHPKPGAKSAMEWIMVSVHRIHIVAIAQIKGCLALMSGEVVVHFQRLAVSWAKEMPGMACGFATGLGFGLSGGLPELPPMMAATWATLQPNFASKTL